MGVKRERKIYRVLDALYDTLWTGQVKNTMDTREWLGNEFDRLHDKIDGIHPAHVDMDEKLADAVLDKMRGPLTISQAASDWLKTQAPHAPVNWTAPLGYSTNGGVMHIRITPEGTLNLEMNSNLGETFWRGEFTPPDYRKEKGDE